MVGSPPWRVVFEQKVDERLDCDDAHETALVAKPLIYQATESLQACTLRRAQVGPCVPQHRFGITERQKRLAWNVAPSITVPGVD